MSARTPLRHAFNTAALDAGVPLRDVQEAASHADPTTTMRYDRGRQSLSTATPPTSSPPSSPAHHADPRLRSVRPLQARRTPAVQDQAVVRGDRVVDPDGQVGRDREREERRSCDAVSWLGPRPCADSCVEGRTAEHLPPAVSDSSCPEATSVQIAIARCRATRDDDASVHGPCTAGRDSVRASLSSVRETGGVTVGRVTVESWGVGPCPVGHAGTSFLVACEDAALATVRGRYSLLAGGYAVVAEPAVVEGGAGLHIRCAGHRGLFVVGGPVESMGRLRYIDGCSDTLLVAPTVRGDPCLNYLHLPAGVVQTDHDHPSLRVGIVVRGDGTCVVDDVAEPLSAGTVFVLEAGTTHRFESGSLPLEIVAWHPDSDFGPTDDDHPMLNRTLRPGSDERVR